MKKNNFLFFVVCTANLTLQSSLKIEPVKPKNTTAQLSFWQNFELDYLQQGLKQLAKKMSTDWTNDESARILIERTELAVQESNSATQNFMKQRIIEIFKTFGIDIFFTPNNFIQRASAHVTPAKTNHQPPHIIHIDHEDENDNQSWISPHYHFHTITRDKDTTDQDNFYDHFEKPRKKVTSHKKNEQSQTIVVPQQLHRIHGGRRTLNKIKRRLAAQEQAELEERLRRQRLIDQENLIRKRSSSGNRPEFHPEPQSTMRSWISRLEAQRQSAPTTSSIPQEPESGVLG
ncbi:MAG TPA: hypothetical protein VLG50_08820 [Candidatus Saccharimonadales bacterium]|nr:hypothetical protein [Candidatus Saccharimonadales bacterium]